MPWRPFLWRSVTVLTWCGPGISLQVLLTSFELLLKDCSTLAPITWQYCIVDEAHRSVGPALPITALPLRRESAASQCACGTAQIVSQFQSAESLCALKAMTWCLNLKP